MTVTVFAPTWFAWLAVALMALHAASVLVGLYRDHLADRLRRSTSLDAAAEDFLGWARETFPDATAASSAEHLRREAEELAASGGEDPDEMADVFMLVVHVAYQRGVDLARATRRKMAVNRARTWGPPDEHGVREHVR